MQALASYPGPHWKHGMAWVRGYNAWQCTYHNNYHNNYCLNNNTCIMIYAWVHGIGIILLWFKNQITKKINASNVHIEFDHLRHWLFTISAMLTTKIINVTCTKMLKLAIMSPITSACSLWWHLVVSLWGSE